MDLSPRSPSPYKGRGSGTGEYEQGLKREGRPVIEAAEWGGHAGRSVARELQSSDL
jgi:hypothetical protein